MGDLFRPRLVIAGTSSGVGKTTCTLGLMAAFQQLGKKVQGFKVGPDYIDPSYHTAITGRVSRNLDTWMCEEETMKEIFLRGSEEAELSIIEGVMGFFDGRDPLSNQGSTADISLLLSAPVILVVNAAGIARSAAAIVLGYQQLASGINIAGVILNKVGSKQHFELIKRAVEQECKIPVVGYLTKNEELTVPERHLGLVPAIERGELAPLFRQLAEVFTSNIDLDFLLKIANQALPLQQPVKKIFTAPQEAKRVKIAVAKDSAFNFYYPENLELLELYGAEIGYFSPLNGETIPKDADGLYLGGGYPEEFAGRLAENKTLIKDLREKLALGMPTFAECGGYMYLTKSLVDRSGEKFAMAGIIPAEVQMQKKLVALGYREATALKDHLLLSEAEQARGHEFHYSTINYLQEDYPYAYEIAGLKGKGYDGYCRENLLAGYTHLYFPSNPQMVVKWLSKAWEFQNRKA